MCIDRSSSRPVAVEAYRLAFQGTGDTLQSKRYDRDSHTTLALASFKELHPHGVASVITDGDLILGEYCVIVEYIICKHGGGRFSIGPDDAIFAGYLYWFYFVNGTPQPGLRRNMILAHSGATTDRPIMSAMAERQHRGLAAVDARLAVAR